MNKQVKGGRKEICVRNVPMTDQERPPPVLAEAGSPVPEPVQITLCFRKGERRRKTGVLKQEEKCVMLACSRANSMMSRMAFRLSPADWDHLLDGESRIIDLDILGFDGGLSGFRALAYYQADKRRGRLKTKRLDSTSMIIQAIGCRPLHGTPAAALPPVFTPARLAPQEQPPTMTVEPELTEADTEALLGPCSCGLSPQCLPDCTRLY